MSELLTKAESKGVKVVLPVDFITADKFDKDANVRLYTVVIIVWEIILELICTVKKSLNKYCIKNIKLHDI